MNDNGLTLPSSGYSNDYNDAIDPSIINDFTAAAFRVTHSSVQGFLSYVSHDFCASFKSFVFMKPVLIAFLIRLMKRITSEVFPLATIFSMPHTLLTMTCTLIQLFAVSRNNHPKQ